MYLVGFLWVLQRGGRVRALPPQCQLGIEVQASSRDPWGWGRGQLACQCWGGREPVSPCGPTEASWLVLHRVPASVVPVPPQSLWLLWPRSPWVAVKFLTSLGLLCCHPSSRGRGGSLCGLHPPSVSVGEGTHDHPVGIKVRPCLALSAPRCGVQGASCSLSRVEV